MDFRRFKHHSWEQLTEKVKKIAKGLEKVYLERKMVCESPQKTKELYKLLQNVKYLNIPFGCEDETIQIISKCCLNLKELHVGYVGIASDERERWLFEARFRSPGPRLRWLMRISRSEIKTDTVACILKNISSLEIFNYFYLSRVFLAMHYYDIVDNKLATVKKYSLTELDFRSSTPYEIDLLLAICTVLCPNVRRLSVGVAWQEHLHLCLQFSKLQCLTMHTFSNRDRIILDDFLKLKGNDLISLDIRGHFSVSIPVLIKNCQKLKKLRMKIVDDRCVFTECMPTLKDMKGVTVQSTKKVCLPTLKHLNELIIYTSETATPLTTEAVCLILNSSPNIEYMCILYGEISDSKLKKTLLDYCELNTLKYLYLGFSGIDVSFLQGLEKVYLERKMVRESPQKTKEIIQLLQNVKYLNIPFGCEDETVQIISKCCLNLKELHVGYVGIASDERERCLCGARFGSPGPRCLWVLRISRSEIKTDTVACILKNISSLEIFNYLYLSRVLLAMHYYDIVDNKLATVKKYSLTELDFRSSTPYEIDLLLAICTVLCPNVKRLSVGVAWQEHVHLCLQFSKLESLTMHTFSNRDRIILDDFLKLKGNDLISLDIRGHFSVSIPVLIENCQKLEKLHMKIVDHRCVFEECMPTLKDMKCVTVQGTKILPSNFKAFERVDCLHF
ncbi:uncharacterized protein LOC118204177 [Stegodyphus dumicola]|uniref:uncharacterized protein LOC118204177 n=1 Tax=Stegodyphus dumicola TaxID=202533 RepID=UPI0015AF9191|nr:uncharacterized protein LOC118204177 [Stegodyphus dumicola]